jgi:predicted RNA polymerase sigma factor
VTTVETHAAIDAVWRIESARLIAGLARITGDVGVAEELAQDALVAALEQWPQSGVPEHPGAWLMGTAKHRAIDLFRRRERLTRKVEELGRGLETQSPLGIPDVDAIDDHIGDDLLRLVFTACHPVLSTEARVGPSGEPVLLLDQDRTRWDYLLIRRGLDALARVEQLGGVLGPYGLQAAIAACHARARVAAETDWVRISALYDALAQVAPSPVVELNRAVALAMAFGPETGLELVDALSSEPSLEAYHLLPSVRGDLLARLDRRDEARLEFERAASLTQNVRERRLLLARAAACIEGTAPQRLD